VHDETGKEEEVEGEEGVATVGTLDEGGRLAQVCFTVVIPANTVTVSHIVAVVAVIRIRLGGSMSVNSALGAPL
jgi:hypothetical protein